MDMDMDMTKLLPGTETRSLRAEIWINRAMAALSVIWVNAMLLTLCWGGLTAALPELKGLGAPPVAGPVVHFGAHAVEPAEAVQLAAAYSAVGAKIKGLD